MTQISTTTTFISNLHLSGRQPQGGYQAFHLAQTSFPVWSVVLAAAVTTLSLVAIVILRRRHRA
jgi:hypothetical protein